MRISEAFSGNYLKAADLPQPRVFIIQAVGMETIGEERSSKPVIRFQGEQRGLVANKVNSLELSSWYGDDTAGWIGQLVEMYATTTFFSGRQVPCIRVRRPAVQYQQPVQQAPQQLYTQPQAQYQLQQPAQPQPVQQQLQQPAVPPVPFDA
jgi:hypothetical protein